MESRGMWRALRGLVGGSKPAPVPAATQELTREKFAQLALARLGERGATEVHYDAANYSVTWHEGANQLTMALANAYLGARALPAHGVTAEIDRFLDSLRAEREARAGGYEAAAPRLMPLVRDVRYFSIGMLQLMHAGVAKEQMPSHRYRGIGGEMVQALCLDSANAMSKVSDETLSEWGVDFDQASVRAVQNLRARSTPSFSKLAEGLYQSGWNDDYDVARLLLPELLATLPIRGAPVVGLPARNRLLVAGADDRNGLDALAQHTAALLESEQRPLSPGLLRFTGKSWEPFEEPLPSTPRLREAGLKMVTHRDYAQQKGLMESILRKAGNDIYVAEFKLFRPKDRPGMLSAATWTRDVATLLPQADCLMFVDAQTKDFLLVPWASAEPVLGDQLKPQGLHPERFLVTGFPDAEQLRRLEAVAMIKARV